MAHWKNREEFKGRVKHWAHKLDVKVNSLALRPMKNKWASCSTAGNLNFNVELLSIDREVGDYVIVHELLHFAVPHHGKLWKSLMRAHLGDYERLDEKLKSFVTRVRSDRERPRTSSKPSSRKFGSRRLEHRAIRG
jgi:predicted metal-dependent hydrolase